MIAKKHEVHIIESEAGWWQRVDEVITFKTKALAEKYVKNYNNKHNNEGKVPSWYMYARYVG